MKTAILLVSPNTSGETVNYICSSFEEKLGEQIDFKVVEKAELLGGFIAKIDGTTYDNSVASSLSRMKRHLMKK